MKGTWDVGRRKAVADAWYRELSKPKQKNLRLLLNHTSIVQAMDKLIQFPGQWQGLDLGNWAKHLSAHVDFALVNYLGHILKQWTAIVAGYEHLSHLINDDDVRFLEKRAPKWCQSDRLAIQDALDKNVLFKDIDSHAMRRQLLKNVLNADGVISSIKTFHKDTAFLTIGLKVIEQNIELKPNKSTSTTSVEKSPRDLFTNLQNSWQDNNLMIETTHGQTTLYSDCSQNGDLAFVGLVLSSLRYFAYISKDRPLLDNRRDQIKSSDEAIRQQYLVLFYNTAKGLGYCNSKVEKGCAASISATMPMTVSNDICHWRTGKPKQSVFLSIESNSFLPNLYKVDSPCDYPSHLHILGNILDKFFNWRRLYSQTMPLMGTTRQKRQRDSNNSINKITTEVYRPTKKVDGRAKFDMVNPALAQGILAPITQGHTAESLLIPDRQSRVSVLHFDLHSTQEESNPVNTDMQLDMEVDTQLGESTSFNAPPTVPERNQKRLGRATNLRDLQEMHAKARTKRPQGLRRAHKTQKDTARAGENVNIIPSRESSPPTPIHEEFEEQI